MQIRCGIALCKCPLDLSKCTVRKGRGRMLEMGCIEHRASRTGKDRPSPDFVDTGSLST